MNKTIFSVILLMLGSHLYAQSELDSIKREILELKMEVNTIELNLSRTKNKFRRGIGIATLGYSVTIAGGLMLGRKHDDLGKVLLVAGGVTGITGTFLLVDAFRFLSPRKQRSVPAR